MAYRDLNIARLGQKVLILKKLWLYYVSMQPATMRTF